MKNGGHDAKMLPIHELMNILRNSRVFPEKLVNSANEYLVIKSRDLDNDGLIFLMIYGNEFAAEVSLQILLSRKPSASKLFYACKYSQGRKRKLWRRVWRLFRGCKKSDTRACLRGAILGSEADFSEIFKIKAINCLLRDIAHEDDLVLILVSRWATTEQKDKAWKSLFEKELFVRGNLGIGNGRVRNLIDVSRHTSDASIKEKALKLLGKTIQ